MALLEQKELTAAKTAQRQMVMAARLEKAVADMEYIAMMSDIELDDEEGDDEQKV